MAFNGTISNITRDLGQLTLTVNYGDTVSGYMTTKSFVYPDDGSVGTAKILLDVKTMGTTLKTNLSVINSYQSYIGVTFTI